MNVVVTGASGRLGRAVCKLLRGRATVLGIDRQPAPAAGCSGDDTARYVRLDLGSSEAAAALPGLLAGAEAVIHVAALHAPHVGVEAEEAFQRVNVDATAALWRAAAVAGVRQFVFTSTTALYGGGPEVTPDGPRAAWLDEDSPPAPRSVYHRSKLAAEALLWEAAARGGPALTVLRVARCFPEPAPLMAVYRLHRGIDARDAARAHALALQGGAPGAPRRFVVSGRCPFVRDDAPALATDAAEVLRRRAPALVAAFEARGWPLPGAIDRVYDGSRAAAGLGFVPAQGYEAVLAEWDAGAPTVLPP